jgi:hypothetical protein
VTTEPDDNADSGADRPALPPESPARHTPYERLTQAQQLSEETAQKLLAFLESTEPVKRLRASQVASAVLGTVGLALFIVGVERAASDLPFLSNAYGSMAVGLVLLIVTGLLLRKLGDID